MKIARVIGTVVASQHHPSYDGYKLVLVRPETPDGKGNGTAFLAVDHHMQAGPNDRVLILQEGNGVRQILGPSAGPIQAMVAGIIDEIHRHEAYGKVPSADARKLKAAHRRKS